MVIPRRERAHQQEAATTQDASASGQRPLEIGDVVEAEGGDDRIEHASAEGQELGVGSDAALRFTPRDLPLSVAVTVLGTVLLVAGYMVWTSPASPHERVVSDQPAGIPVVSPPINSGWLLILVALVAAIAFLGVRLRGADLDQRRRSRQRLVHAQDTARRDLERDLHDGAQARLVALRLLVGLAAAEAARLPDDHRIARLRDLLERLGDEADGTIRTLRDLSRGLHPPVLESDGIAAALRAGARGLPIDVEVSAPDLARCAPSVEAAVYFACLEAINNAATHAGANCPFSRWSPTGRAGPRAPAGGHRHRPQAGPAWSGCS
ncbi:MAG: hypothetical protein EA388_10860 [Nitriliruptor sp.]|nr:MAG: hypothetical protein EA388_10860 [Nitriliruptor sp.]